MSLLAVSRFPEPAFNFRNTGTSFSCGRHFAGTAIESNDPRRVAYTGGVDRNFPVFATPHWLIGGRANTNVAMRVCLCQDAHLVSRERSGWLGGPGEGPQTTQQENQRDTKTIRAAHAHTPNEARRQHAGNLSAIAAKIERKSASPQDVAPH